MLRDIKTLFSSIVVMQLLTRMSMSVSKPFKIIIMERVFHFTDIFISFYHIGKIRD